MGNENNPTQETDVARKNRMMKFWLFGSFTIIFAASVIYAGFFIGLALLGTWQFWASILITAALFIGAYYLYSNVLNK